MKLPRNLSARDLEKALFRAYGYSFTRQTGSHRRLTSTSLGEHHLTVPDHTPLRAGTLRAILGKVMEHRRISLATILQELNLG